MPDIVTSQVFTDGERGITATKMNNIIANSVIQPSFVTAKPSSSTLDPTDQLLEVKGAGTYATITGQQLIDSVSASVTQNITPTIWSVRLRSFNSLGQSNPTFEVDQINVGNTVANVTGAKIIDRWATAKGGTMAISAGQNAAISSDVCVPGTNFRITRSFYRITLTTAQASLGASDYVQVYSFIEGPNWRELCYDVHSVQLLVRSSVSGLKFGLTLQDPGSTTKTLTKLCTIPSTNWTLITLPNLPLWPAGNFTVNPGSIGYNFLVVLAAGSTVTSPANDTWQNGSFNGALGQSNFAANAVNSTFDIAFVQHEPGAQCSTLMDKPFTQNYDDCLRYYCKTYDYGIKPGTTSANAVCSLISQGNADVSGWLPFPKRLAKVPSGGISVYNFSTGAVQSIQTRSGSNIAVNSINNAGESGFNGFTLASAQVANMPCNFHYVADTGW